ncbi:E3 ubiquitin-protein ligase RNF14-like isoform X1 [Physella acuta]|uniref:E3 ubiquitin-protein ligase RNF14-like isoform X1 n=1 Tax=Physella acuta TaxID=109671 RepID=UPI0027DC26D8|nr:E3 ubiquitin-protein ligase RNF14-like isoform X1 [Physella acuta]
MDVTKISNNNNSFNNDLNGGSNIEEQTDEITVLKSMYNTEADEKVKLISAFEKESHELFKIIVKVCPKAETEKIHIDVVLPIEEETQYGATAAGWEAPPTTLKNLPLNRSTSGRKWQGSFDVKYLSPLYLDITFPPTYPSSDPPSYQLSCPWLTSTQLECTGQMLDNLWQEGKPMVIVFTWIDWLENNLLSYLGITDHLVLHLLSSTLPDDGDEKNSASDGLGEVIAHMIRYNHEQMRLEFCQSMQECPVCLMEKPGIHFHKLQECQHFFCTDCMREFCDLHVRDGTVEALKCPDIKCKTILPPYIVQAVLGPEAYNRWEVLLLQKTLDAMADTDYCPRCNSLVIAEAEESLHLAHCTVCLFSFCTECRRCWHQGRPCQTDDELLQDLNKRVKRGGLSVAEHGKFLEMKRKLQEEIKNKEIVVKKTRSCPSCKARIEKIDGCNKMTCRCGISFCWVCGRKIDGYEHFTQSGCLLIPTFENLNPPNPVKRMPPDELLRIQAQLEVNPDLSANRCLCPGCKQVNLKKTDHNNHIKCWNCKSNFCFLCKQLIRGAIMAHFMGPCVQHS